MRQFALPLLSLTLLASPNVAQEVKPLQTQPPASVSDPLSYGIGFQIGSQLGSQGLGKYLKMQDFVTGLTDALAGKKVAIPPEKIEAAMADQAED